MKVNLIAIQARPVLDDYASFDAFYRKCATLTDQAMRRVDRSLPTLLSFPEGIGLFLSFVPWSYEEAKRSKTFVQLMVKAIPKYAQRYLTAAWRFKSFGVRTVFQEAALEAEKAYLDTFSSLAREHGIYLLAGSIYAPIIEDEPIKGRHILDRRVYNLSYMFSPRGTSLGRVGKVNLAPPIEKKFGFAPAPRQMLRPMDTPIGRLGILVCYDAFHQTLVEYYDSLGVEILLTPSHNEHYWDAPAGFDKSITQAEAWFLYGPPAAIQGRENLRYLVSSMMVCDILEIKAEGRSLIAVNTGRTDPQASHDGILTIADSPSDEEIITAVVEMPDRRPAREFTLA